MKVALIISSGFEESEAITIVDILRRANLTCDIIGLTKEVISDRQVKILSDYVLKEKDMSDYDMLVFAGGRKNVENLRACKEVLEIVQDFDNKNKYIAAMCAAPLILDDANIIKEKNYTAYVGYDKLIRAKNFKEDLVVVDKNLITSRGPATTYEFAYKILEVLNTDPEPIKDRMLYKEAFNIEGENNG